MKVAGSFRSPVGLSPARCLILYESRDTPPTVGARKALMNPLPDRREVIPGAALSFRGDIPAVLSVPLHLGACQHTLLPLEPSPPASTGKA